MTASLSVCSSSSCYAVLILDLALPISRFKRLKQSGNRPDVAQRVPGGLGSQISMTFGT
jgi:hypothetical protein